MIKAQDNRIRRNGKIATPRNARKEHRCTECPDPIAAGTLYYEVVLAGSGLGSLKFPARVHPGDCVESNLGVDNGG